MEDKRNILRDEQPFLWKMLKDRKAMIYWYGRNIKVIKGKEVDKLEKAIAVGDDYKIQLLLAKITGHFKHGNERKDEQV